MRYLNISVLRAVDVPTTAGVLVASEALQLTKTEGIILSLFINKSPDIAQRIWSKNPKSLQNFTNLVPSP